MTQSQWMSLIRSIGLFIGGMLVARGMLSNTQLVALIDQIVNAIPMISAGLTAAYSLYLMVWGLMKHTDAAKIAEVSALPEVKSIVIKASAPASSAGAAAAIDPAQPKVMI